MRDKTPIEINQTQKSAEFAKSGWWRKIMNGLNLGRQRGYASGGDMVSKEVEGRD